MFIHPFRRGNFLNFANTIRMIYRRKGLPFNHTCFWCQTSPTFPPKGGTYVIFSEYTLCDTYRWKDLWPLNRIGITSVINHHLATQTLFYFSQDFAAHLLYGTTHAFGIWTEAHMRKIALFTIFCSVCASTLTIWCHRQRGYSSKGSFAFRFYL